MPLVSFYTPWGVQKDTNGMKWGKPYHFVFPVLQKTSWEERESTLAINIKKIRSFDQRFNRFENFVTLSSYFYTVTSLSSFIQSFPRGLLQFDVVMFLSFKFWFDKHKKNTFFGKHRRFPNYITFYAYNH